MSRTEPFARLRLPDSNDTRLLLAGVVAFLALVAYLAVDFATTRTLPVAAATTTTAPTLASQVAPFVAHNSNLVRISVGTRGAYAVRVTPATTGSYGALVPTLLLHPPNGHKFVVGLWLRGSRRGGRIGVEVDEFRPGTTVYVVQTRVATTARWHHYTFSGRVKGSWLGLGMYVYRQADVAVGTWFAVRDLAVKIR